MTFLLVNRFFGNSQTPTGRMLEDVAQEFVARGHQVTIVASATGYVRPVPRSCRFPISAFKFLLSAFRRSPLQAPSSKPPPPHSHLPSPDSRSLTPDSSSTPPHFFFSPVWQCPSGPRLLNWAWFWLASLVRLTFCRYDACLLLTDPPFLPFAARIASLVRRRKRIYVYWWTMDLYPEALHSAGMLHEHGWFYRLLHCLNGFGIGGLTGIICLGGRQRQRLQRYPQWPSESAPPDPCPLTPDSRPLTPDPHPLIPDSQLQAPSSKLPPPRSIVIPPWDLRPLERIDPAQNRILSRFGWQGRKIALYAGNLGEGHLFAQFVAGARHLQETGDAEWLFVFAIRGAGKAGLSQAATGLSNVLVLDYLPESDTSHLLSAATIHLISMKPGWEGVIVPSKLYGVLATGAPVLFIGPPDADTATEIQRMGCGTCLEPGASGQAVAEALNRLHLASDTRQQPIAPADPTGPSRVASFITGLTNND